LQPDDTLVVQNPVYEKLVFHFRVYDLSHHYFWYGGQDRAKAYTYVAVQTERQTLASVLNEVLNAQLAADATPAIVSEHPPVTVYRVDLAQIAME
jgi:hypothetical protein